MNWIEIQVLVRPGGGYWPMGLDARGLITGGYWPMGEIDRG